ncbi:efflux RND transporter periplasmic adaptor subunit [Oscillatoria sp. FACHB-1407]|uniref:efflux RND transporter periplasmic adaptor subunit n=1 Tax=Oscillatoria sp. FACHB-1407 TaxID=2692847 RepID=UPI0016829393|nr:efflux RND transporter periplasmic adaptor subunit [Oscillatoria sp. FACHB-1407]MBD2462097.1 efflux RND transporter periplasmic adaptor subunit [Oscillatoria sp. FACHB-1407]
MSGKRKFKTGVQWLIGSGVLALLSLLGWLAYAVWLNRPADPVSVRLLTVERDTVETTINASGTVQLGGQQTLKSPAEGAVEEVLVQPGDRVTQGQVLLTLRNPERQTALANQEVKIVQQELTLARHQQRISESQEQLVSDREWLQRLSALAEAGAIAQTQVQEQADKVRTTLTNLRAAESDARTANLELKSLRLESQRIQRQLQDTVITAPITGIVLGVNVDDGDGVELRTELLTLGDPSQELVQLQLSTLDAAQVEVNQRVRVSVIGPNPEVFMGRVQSLYPQAIVPSAEGQSSYDQSDQATVPTIIRLDQPTRTLIPGSQVNVEIILEQRPNVIALAVEAVQQGDEPFVWVRDAEGKAQQRPIELGLEGLTEIEVTSGLQVGEEIILPSPDVVLTPGALTAPTSESTAGSPE